MSETTEVREAPLPGLVLEYYEHLNEDYDPDEPGAREFTSDVDRANMTTSLVANPPVVQPGPVMHKVVLDIDLPAKLVPSTTEGHFHLYLDHQVEHDVYMRLLAALGEAGILEPGYVAASEARGYTSTRLPWVKKPVPLTTVEPFFSEAAPR